MFFNAEPDQLKTSNPTTGGLFKLHLDLEGQPPSLVFFFPCDMQTSEIRNFDKQRTSVNQYDIAWQLRVGGDRCITMGYNPLFYTNREHSKDKNEIQFHANQILFVNVT